LKLTRIGIFENLGLETVDGQKMKSEITVLLAELKILKDAK
jgi:lysophospholipid acyltransferase (LPLAT)-like uncharacterized protein